MTLVHIYKDLNQDSNTLSKTAIRILYYVHINWVNLFATETFKKCLVVFYLMEQACICMQTV